MNATIYVYAPTDKHAFGYLFAEGESPAEALERVERKHGELYGVDYECVGTYDEFAETIHELGSVSGVYRR